MVADGELVEDESSAVLGQTVRQLDVLGPPESLVEPACREQELAWDRGVARVELPVGRGVVPANHGVVLLVQHGLLPTHERTRPVVGRSKHGPDYHDLTGAAVVAEDVLFDQVGLGDDIVVNEEKQIASRQAGAVIARRGGSAIGLRGKDQPEGHPRLPDEFVGPVRGARQPAHFAGGPLDCRSG